MNNNEKKRLKRPKRPLNPYLLFLQERIGRMKEEKPMVSHRKMVKEIGELWNSMGEEEKKGYVELYLPEKEKYHCEVMELMKNAKVKKEEEGVKKKRGRPKKEKGEGDCGVEICGGSGKKVKVEIKGTVTFDLELSFLD